MIPWIMFVLIGALFTVAGAKLALGENDKYGLVGMALLIFGIGIFILGALGVRAMLM